MKQHKCFDYVRFEHVRNLPECTRVEYVIRTEGEYYHIVPDLAQAQSDALQVADTSDVPAGYRGLVLHVNDHGNATLYRAFANGNLREIWGMV